MRYTGPHLSAHDIDAVFFSPNPAVGTTFFVGDHLVGGIHRSDRAPVTWPDEKCLVTLGERGVIAIDNEGSCFLVSPPSIEPLNTLGAGDCFVAGYMSAGSAPFLEKVRCGCAVATGSVLSAVPGTPAPSSVRSILDSLKVDDL